MLVRKWTSFRATNKNSSDRSPSTQQRRCQGGSNSFGNRSVSRLWKFDFCLEQVMHVNRFAVRYGSTVHRISVNRYFRQYRSRNRSMVGDPPKYISLNETNNSIVRVA